MKYNFDYSSAAFGGLIGIGIALLIFFVIVILAICVLQIIGTWKILTKAGKPGWGALIPFYNSFLLCEITGVNPWWILIVALSGLLGIIPIVGSLATMVISVYYCILLNVSLARSFKKDDSYAVGLILLAPFFYLALGCGKSKYVGAKPMNDIIFNNINQKNKKEEKTCPKCGKKIEKDSKYCTECGNEVK